MSPLIPPMVANLGSAALLLPILLLTGGATLSPQQLGIIAFAGVVQIALPYALFQIALRRVDAVAASLIILLEPVLNPVWVALTVDERPAPLTYAGGAALLAALVVQATAKPRE
jgi:drug/metabolite transporter (DMT)-like permease